MISPQLRKAIRWFALLATGVALSGCIGQSSPKVSFYSLLSMEQTGTTAAAPTEPGLKIGIGPITIPEALKRAQIVTRDARNVYDFDEYHRWAGILDKDIATVMGENLGDLLGTDKVASFPWMFHFKPTYRVIVEVIQFDGELAGEAVLNARWAIIDQEGTVSLASGRSVLRQPVGGGDYTALVKAESMLLADLCREIAQGIKSLPEQK